MIDRIDGITYNDDDGNTDEATKATIGCREKSKRSGLEQGNRERSERRLAK